MAQDSVLNQIPTDINLMQPTQYTLVFPKLPYLKFFVTSAMLPSVSTNAVQVSTPFAPTYRHGDTLVYDPLTVTILCDEELRAWYETYQWIRGLTAPQSFRQYLLNRIKEPGELAFPQETLYSDAVLSINTNSNTPLLQIIFANCHPTYLGMLQFNNADDASSTMTFDVTFQYDYFTMKRF